MLLRHSVVPQAMTLLGFTTRIMHEHDSYKFRLIVFVGLCKRRYTNLLIN